MEFGHIIVYGDTNSGKTYYTRYLVNKLHPKKVFVYAGVPDQWIDSGTHNLENVFDTFDNIKEIVNYCKEKKNKVKRENKFIIIFDDFNKRINTQTNQDYLNLFTEGRHAGIRVINLAHHVQDIGPVVRNNARYIIFTKMPNDELKRIADIYYDSKYSDICKLLHNTDNYTVGILDKRNKELWKDIATEEIEDRATEDKLSSVVVVKGQAYNEYPEVAPLNNNPSSAVDCFVGNRCQYRGGSTDCRPSTIGSQSNKLSNRDFYDNSNTIFNTAIKNEDKINVVQTNHISNISKIHNEYECQRVKDSEETRYLIRKPWKTDTDIKKIIHTLNNELKPSVPFNICNYQDGAVIFLHKFYGEYYSRPTGQDDIIDNIGTMYESRNNPVTLFSMGLDKVKKIIMYQY